MSVTSDQRFKAQRPCPVCAGYDRAARASGARCWGYLSTNGKIAYCTSDARAGHLPASPSSGTFAHKLAGDCSCGVEHAPAQPAAGKKASKKDRGEIDVVYSYVDENSVLLSQAVRWKPKGFSQRRPDPEKPNQWIWRLGNTRQVLYKLPALMAADPLDPVFIVEGEKDAERLWSLGAVATTNIMGAGKWRDEYADALVGRHVVILPDNDPPSDTLSKSYVGQKHAMVVARSVYRKAESVRVIELPGLPEKGDISDWFDAGGTIAALRELAAETQSYGPDNPYHPGGEANGHHLDQDPGTAEVVFSVERESKHRNMSVRFIQGDGGLRESGEFILADGRFFYFDKVSKSLCDLEGFEMKALLNEIYQVNETEAFYKHLLADMKVETHYRGRRAKVHSFAHYERDTNKMYVDLCNGRMLRLDGKTIEEIDNGIDEVLFIKAFDTEPWNYVPNPTGPGLRETLIGDLNFVSGEGTPQSPEEQRLLLLIWMLAIAFESVQPTKPLALAMGVAGSGKSFMFRRIGRLFYGSGFNVTGIRKDGESDFFVQITNSPFSAFDNVDNYIPWLEDALATSSTGMKIVKRVLYETNRAISFEPRCFIALTARTPRFRRDDVAERVIPLRLDKLKEKRPEGDLLHEVLDRRDTLMSEYVQLLNLVVGQPEPKTWDSGLRLADFAKIATRIGDALEQPNQVRKILVQLQTSQHLYATEENDLFLLLDIWSNETSDPAGMGIETTNDGRTVLTGELFAELENLAGIHGYKWSVGNASSLGKKLKSLEPHLQVRFEVEHDEIRSGSWWRFTRIEGLEIFL